MCYQTQIPFIFVVFQTYRAVLIKKNHKTSLTRVQKELRQCDPKKSNKNISDDIRRKNIRKTSQALPHKKKEIGFLIQIYRR